MLAGLKTQKKVDLKDDKWTRKEKMVLLIALVSALAVLVYSTIFVFTMIPTSKIMP
jgi:flagellar biosynthesis/type III secretory pathway M-ring protein FliF/YscJ